LLDRVVGRVSRDSQHPIEVDSCHGGDYNMGLRRASPCPLHRTTLAWRTPTACGVRNNRINISLNRATP
ncbi:MAG: hypothetical protein K8R65_02415, partial [Nitrospirae bacterium]|nr:hypothetical protein [Nitrospirota bacterium]